MPTLTTTTFLGPETTKNAQKKKKNRSSNSVCVTPTTDEKIPCRNCKKCFNNAAVSWASNLNPEDIWDLCEDRRVDEFGGWLDGVVPIKTSTESAESNTQATESSLDTLATQPSLAIVCTGSECAANLQVYVHHEPMHDLPIHHEQPTLAMMRKAVSYMRLSNNKPTEVGWEYSTASEIIET